jgi:photosystem I subunit 4
MSEDKQNKNRNQTEESTPEAAGGYQTPIKPSNRKTGVADEVDTKPTAVPESGSSDTLVEGSPNQGTEKR